MHLGLVHFARNVVLESLSLLPKFSSLGFPKNLLCLEHVTIVISGWSGYNYCERVGQACSELLVFEALEPVNSVHVYIREHYVLYCNRYKCSYLSGHAWENTNFKRTYHVRAGALPSGVVFNRNCSKSANYVDDLGLHLVSPKLSLANFSRTLLK